MMGAHCLVCQEDGPDLTLGSPTDPPPDLTAHIEFTCSKCARRWTWRALWQRDRWRYVAQLPAPTRLPKH